MPPKRTAKKAEPAAKRSKGAKGAAAEDDGVGSAGAAAVEDDGVASDWDADKEATAVLFCGTSDWDIAAKKGPSKGENIDIHSNVEDLLGPHRLRGLSGHTVTQVAASITGTHFGIITSEGLLFMFGRNEFGELGLGDTAKRNKPTQVALGRHHTLVLLESGSVVAFGDNRCGQLGIGSLKGALAPAAVTTAGPCKKVACGADFSVVLLKSGILCAFGHPENGQLGDGSDGKYFVTASKISHNWVMTPQPITKYLDKDRQPLDGVEIVDVCCGAKHTVALDSKQRVFTWGFGGYGRLGHNDCKDEMFPRCIHYFCLPNMGATKIAAGGQFSFAVCGIGQLMFWGQFKMSGEATMYPKPETELSGWHIVKVVAGSKHIAVLADEKVVTWGAAPTYGELCYGEGQPKSSTKPKIAEPLEGLGIADLACGYANTILLAKVTAANKEKIKALPVF